LDLSVLIASVVTVIETGTETVVFLQNRTETVVLCLCIDGSVLKWSSSGALNVNSSCKSSHPLCLAGGCYRWDQRWDRRRPCTPRVRTVVD